MLYVAIESGVRDGWLGGYGKKSGIVESKLLTLVAECEGATHMSGRVHDNQGAEHVWPARSVLVCYGERPWTCDVAG